jgi:hypothetical protein
MKKQLRREMKRDTAGNQEMQCYSCGSNWAAGNYTDGCEECGGGAMEHPCLACGGKCGNIWKKMLVDTHDSGQAHWLGACGLKNR